MQVDARELETERLRLRPWEPEDDEPFARLNADAEVMEFFSRPLSRDESDAFAARLREAIVTRGWGLWAVAEKRGDRFIGFVGLQPTSESLPVAPAVEIGWRLARSHWGRGLASEAARRALAVAFERLGLPEVVSLTAACNDRSRAVMKRIGMTFDGESFLHPKIPEPSKLREHVVYRMPRERWLSLTRHAAPAGEELRQA